MKIARYISSNIYPIYQGYYNNFPSNFMWIEQLKSIPLSNTLPGFIVGGIGLGLAELRPAIFKVLCSIFEKIFWLIKFRELRDLTVLILKTLHNTNLNQKRRNY